MTFMAYYEKGGASKHEHRDDRDAGQRGAASGQRGSLNDLLIGEAKFQSRDRLDFALCAI